METSTVYSFAKRYIEGEKLVGLKIGDFSIDNQCDSFIKIGCHFLLKAEIKSLVNDIENNNLVK